MVLPVLAAGAALGGLSVVGLQSLFGSPTKKEAGVSQSPTSSNRSLVYTSPLAHYAPSSSMVDARVSTFAPQYGYSSNVQIGSPGATSNQPMDFTSRIDAQSRPVVDYVPTSSFGITPTLSTSQPSTSVGIGGDMMLIALLGLGAILLLKK